MLENRKAVWSVVSLAALVLLLLGVAMAPMTVSAEPTPTDTPEPEQPWTTPNEECDPSAEIEAFATTISGYPMDELADEEVAGLLWMREEEKLARDVYLTLYERWELPVFKNIARSEQVHMEAVLALLERYSLDDPAMDAEIGEFANEDLQALYDQLVETGDESLEAALKVGAAIEEIDILDLERWLEQTDNEDIQLVYENLMMGSRNHLRAFTSTLEMQTGATYEPQYLTQEAYDEIVNGEMEMGMGHGDMQGGLGHGGAGPHGGQ